MALFFGDTGGGKQIRIRQFVAVALEVLQLDQALFEEGLDAEVGFAQAHAQRLGQFTLRHLRIRFQQAQYAELNFVVGGRYLG